VEQFIKVLKQIIMIKKIMIIKIMMIKMGKNQMMRI
jgi:hypothetical protein